MSITSAASSIKEVGSSAMGSVSSFLGGSTGGMSNSGLLAAGGSLLQSVSGFLAGNSEAKAQKKAQDKQWQAQMVNTREQYRQLAQQEQVAGKEANQASIDNQVSLLQQQGQVELLAGATGTGGGSVSSLLGDLSAQAGRNQSQIIDNYENAMESFTNQAKAIRTGGQMQMRSFNKPSILGSLVSGIGGAASAYSSGSKIGKDFSTAHSESRTFSSGKK